MFSKSSAKFIKSLQLKKYRKQEEMFLVEGKKSVLEVIKSGYFVEQVLGTEQFIAEFDHELKGAEVVEISEEILKSLGTLKSNNSALAVVRYQQQPTFKLQDIVLALDGINDPGNLGTLLRIADWYGIKTVIASEETADFYNPKVISASKGSFTRVQYHVVDLPDILNNYKGSVYGADMTGTSVHEINFNPEAVILLGNEANGISTGLSSLITEKITIPSYGGAESLNVAMAGAIICDNMRRAN